MRWSETHSFLERASEFCYVREVFTRVVCLILPVYWSRVAGTYDGVNNHSGSIKCGEFLD